MNFDDETKAVPAGTALQSPHPASTPVIDGRMMRMTRLASNMRLPRQVILLALAALLNDVSSEMIYPLLPVFLTVQIGATPLIAGMIEALADALASLMKYGSGLWSDRLPKRKPLIAGGYGLAALSRLLIATAASWPAVLLARLADRTGKGIRSAPRDALIVDVTPVGDRGRAFGFHRALDHTGAVIGPLITALLIGVFVLPIRTVLLLATLPAAAGVLMLTFTLTEPHRDRPASLTSRAPRSPLPRPFWRALLPIALFYVANSSDFFLILFAKDRGMSLGQITLLWAGHHAVRALLTTTAGAFSDRVGRRRPLLITGWLCYALIYLLFPFSRSPAEISVMFVVYAIPFVLTEPVERAWIAAILPPESRGRGFGVYYLTGGVCTLAGTALFGLLYQNVSAISAFHAGAGFAILAAAAVAAQSEPQV